MTSKIKVDRHIREFEKMLDIYSSYKGCLRTLKLNSILGKKSKFTIEEMNPRMTIDLNNSNGNSILTSSDYQTSSVFTIKNLSFIISDDLYVDEIELKYDIINKELLNRVIENSNDIKISLKVSYNGLTKEQQVAGFYLELSDLILND